MANFKSVVLFLLVDFGEVYLLLLLLLVTCDWGKTKSTPSPTHLDCTVRLDWSLTINKRQVGAELCQAQVKLDFIVQVGIKFGVEACHY